ncbi:MAG: twin-arginine translocase TatA/TatE family subunit [Thermoleophilia bacterium]|nr:twin-arginine translocase TatA/TatE family subunit [Thermoleophilia bacterium]MDH5334153.1 twin-arginine translocase TatA/TatE family subunit [Thermoleophilia bacterium]
MPFGLGIWEVVILLAVIALLFGAKGVPDVARRLGMGMREVRDAVADVDPRRMLDAPPPAPRDGARRPDTETRPPRDDVSSS